MREGDALSLPKGWKEVKLGDILEIKHGYGFKGEFFKEYETDNVLVTPGNFNIGGGFKNEKLKYYDGPISEDFILKPNDVIVTMTDLSKMADTIGYSAKVPSSSKTYLHNQRIGLIKLLTDEVDIDFIYWFLRTSNYQRYVAGSSTGATVKHTSPTKIYSYKGIIPPLETQKKIASILSGYDDLIENNLKRIKILEEMAQQTYEEWFVRMRFPGHQSATINPETGLPEGWKQCRMGDILNFTNGFAFKSKDYDEKGIYSIVTIKNVQEGYFENSKFDKILEIPSKVKESQRLKTGDLVMSLTGNVGRLCFVYGENLLLNQRVCKIDSKAIGFVYCTLRSSYFKNKIENLANGAAQQNLSTIDMENLIIDFPKNELIDDFESFVNPIFNSILNLNIQNQRLREARDILLPRLMMGMIEV